MESKKPIALISVSMLFFVSGAHATLPQGAEDAMGMLQHTIVVFLFYVLGFSFFGMLLARRVNSRSKALGRVVFSALSLAGVLFGAYTAFGML